MYLHHCYLLKQSHALVQVILLVKFLYLYHFDEYFYMGTGFMFYFVAPELHISTVSPLIGSTLGGTRVNITLSSQHDSSFYENSIGSWHCWFGQQKVVGTVLSDKLLQCHSPPGILGSVPIQVSEPYKFQFESKFHFERRTAIKSISAYPSLCSISDETLVTVADMHVGLEE